VADMYRRPDRISRIRWPSATDRVKLPVEFGERKEDGVAPDQPASMPTTVSAAVDHAGVTEHGAAPRFCGGEIKPNDILCRP
jgi:hypothetical protein